MQTQSLMLVQQVILPMGPSLQPPPFISNNLTKEKMNKKGTIAQDQACRILATSQKGGSSEVLRWEMRGFTHFQTFKAPCNNMRATLAKSCKRIFI